MKSWIVVKGAGLALLLLHVSVTKCPRKNCVGRGGLGLGYLPEEGEVRVRANRASCNPSRLGLGWGLYLWRRVVSWPCGKTSNS